MAELMDASEQKSKISNQNAEAMATQPQVRWNDANMKSSYANVCNATSTREEVVLLFGMNQAWHAGQKEVTVQLTDRIILNPFAAKRLSLLLSSLVREHEARFGSLNLEVASPGVQFKR